MRHSISLVLVVMIKNFNFYLCRVLMKEIFELKMKKADKAEINERKIQVTSWCSLISFTYSQSCRSEICMDLHYFGQRPDPRLSEKLNPH
jgi:hypothetical protein